MDMVFELPTLMSHISNREVDGAVSSGGQGEVKRGWQRSCEYSEGMLRSTSCYTYSTSWGRAWGIHPHNGSVSYPMRPVQ